MERVSTECDGASVEKYLQPGDASVFMSVTRNSWTTATRIFNSITLQLSHGICVSCSDRVSAGNSVRLTVALPLGSVTNHGARWPFELKVIYMNADTFKFNDYVEWVKWFTCRMTYTALAYSSGYALHMQSVSVENLRSVLSSVDCNQLNCLFSGLMRVEQRVVPT